MRTGKRGGSMANKAILINLGNVRIKEYDNLNVVIERQEVVFNPMSKQTESKWRFKGYSDSIFNALILIQKNEWLIDKKAQMGLENYLKQVEESNERIRITIEQVKKSTEEVLEVIKT